MTQINKTSDNKKVAYFGKVNEEIRLLRDYLKGSTKRRELWNLEIFSDPFVLEYQIRNSRYDVILLELSDDFESSANLIEMINLHTPSTCMIGVVSRNPSRFASLILSGCVHDIIDLRQDRQEIMKIMSASLARQSVANHVLVEGRGVNLMIGRWGGKTMTQIATRIPKIVDSAITCIHITGESGTGKEVVAQMFRKAVGDEPFIAISCATIPETLLEATLFGSIKGAFTGATKDLKGIFEEANGGWIFLDEVGCLSKSAQAALLRAIENQEVTPVGESRSKKLNFRVISATNASLKELTRKGEFRLDLYNRLAEIEICLPPLRERQDELPDLIQCLVETLPGGPYRISAAARRLLESHPWVDGNVRQLRNCLRAMTEFHVEGTLTPQGIPRRILEEACAYAKGNGTSEEKATYSLSHPAPHRESSALIDSAQNDLRVRWSYSKDDEIDFDRMSLELFYQIAKTITHRNGRFSARDLASALRMSRSTISRRINQAIDQKVGDFETLMASFGIRGEIFD